MSEWSEFQEWKKSQVSEPKLEEAGFSVIPENERVDLTPKDCHHTNAYVVKKRDDGLEDCYCPDCACGGIYSSLGDFKRP